MNRRRFLCGTAATGVVGTAGCLERLGFKQQSAWANPPLVEDRPNAVYLPSGTEEMGTYGTASNGEYALEVSYTFPHRFWIPGQGGSKVTVETDDSMHLMLTVWDVKTETVLPVDMTIELRHKGEPVDTSSSPWPMLSQRMGFHYGDNITLPEEGAYTLSARVGPVDAVRTGAFKGRLANAATLEVDFEFNRSNIHNLGFDLIKKEKRGDRGAVPLMDHSSMGGDSKHNQSSGGVGSPPTAQGPSVDSLPGELLGTKRSADAKISAIVTDLNRFSNDKPYLAVCPRTPYNNVILPFMSLTAAVERDGSVVFEKPLHETLDHEFGHHYGIASDSLENGDTVTISVNAPPKVSRHDGYETAFFDFGDVTFTLA